jgi:hypothetical protein
MFFYGELLVIIRRIFPGDISCDLLVIIRYLFSAGLFSVTFW